MVFRNPILHIKMLEIIILRTRFDKMYATENCKTMLRHKMGLNREGNKVYSWIGTQCGRARFKALVQLTSMGNTLNYCAAHPAYHSGVMLGC